MPTGQAVEQDALFCIEGFDIIDVIKDTVEQKRDFLHTEASVQNWIDENFHIEISELEVSEDVEKLEEYKPNEIIDQLIERVGILNVSRIMFSRASDLERATLIAEVFEPIAPSISIDALGWPPFAKLSEEEVDAVKKRGTDRAWSNRREFSENPYPWNTNVFSFVREEYKQWIPGLTQSMLKRSDFKLYAALVSAVSEVGMPEGLDIPSEADAEIRYLINPMERVLKMLARETMRRQKRDIRSNMVGLDR